ncbi:MAG: DUF4249 domain-containing protein [Dysgonamonadaceae bacterium]|jgi:hypothetical protein|nr:DUF4249 domain-containing protein [Dysgonamonadaceae bacterium]
MMMKNNINQFLFFLLSFILTGCVSEFKADLPAEDIDMLIVEGNIIANTQCTFYLEKSFSLNESRIPEQSFDVEANLVVVGSGGYKSQPASYLGAGRYQVNIGDLDDGQNYGIEITYNGDLYGSDPLPPIATPEIDSVSWKQPEKAGLVFLYVSTHGENNAPGFYLWNYAEDWEIKAAYETSLFYDPKRLTYYEDHSFAFFYCWLKNEINPVLVGSSESLTENKIVNKKLYEQHPNSDRYSVLYSVNVTQQSLTKEAYEYYSNKAKLSQDMGGLFTPQPSELKGNITCFTNSAKKVMGYVSVLKNVTEKRIFINEKDITGRPVTNCEEISGGELSGYLAEREMTLIDLYNAGFRPVGLFIPNPSIGDPSDYWVRIKCTDCTANSGSKLKPDFWPNNHK